MIKIRPVYNIVSGSVLDRMCSMCRYCGVGLSESNFDNKKQGNESSLKLNGKVSIRPCKSCGEKLERANAKWHSTSPYATPLISPTTSLLSTDSCVSTCSNYYPPVLIL